MTSFPTLETSSWLTAFPSMILSTFLHQFRLLPEDRAPETALGTKAPIFTVGCPTKEPTDPVTEESP